MNDSFTDVNRSLDIRANVPSIDGMNALEELNSRDIDMATGIAAIES